MGVGVVCLASVWDGNHCEMESTPVGGLNSCSVKPALAVARCGAAPSCHPLGSEVAAV